MNREENSGLQTAAVAALAATSSTPFKTAFKIYMRIAIAQSLILVAVVTGFAGFVYLLSIVLTKGN